MIKFLKKISGVQLWLMILLAMAGVMVCSEYTAKPTVSASGSCETAGSDKLTVDSNYNSSLKSSQETNDSGHLYRVCEDGGVVAVFSDGVAVIRGTVPVTDLPDKDRELLKKGVTFKSYAEMIRFIQDYE